MSIFSFVPSFTRTHSNSRRPSRKSEIRTNSSSWKDCSTNFGPILAAWALLALHAAAADPSAAFQINAPVPLPVASADGNGQRIFWNSQPGLTYELQTTTDLRALSGAGGLDWITIGTITAAGPVSWADDEAAASDSIRYYRVLMLAPTNDVTPPALTPLQATQPQPPPVAPVSVLSVTATDNVGVTSVDFLEGNNVIGPATHGLGNNWSLDWMLGGSSAPLSGRYYLRARAFDAAGNVGYSPVLEFNLAPANQSCLTFGGVTICADAETVAGGVYTFSGNIRINALRLSSGATVTASATQISGSGDVIVPGLNTVLSGSFDIDPQTGWLTIRTGTIPTFPLSGILLSQQATFAPTQLSVNVYSNYLSGAGSLTLQLPGQQFGPVVLAGSFDYSPASGRADVTGSLVLSNLLSASGKTALNLNDSTFTLTGNASFQSGNNGTYYLSNGVVQLTFANPTSPNLYVSGDLGVSESLALRIQGNVTANGQVELTGTGRGPIGGFDFDPIEVTLFRPPGASSITTANFRGKLLNQNFSGYLLSGTVLSTGDLDITGTGTVTFNGFVFNPLNIHLIRNASTANQVVANLDGTLRLSYIKPVTFTGVLRQDGSVDLSGQSGPYTVASFGGVVPRMDDPSLTFDEQTFVGCYQLGGRDPSVQTQVNFHFTRDTDAAGGNTTLGVTAVTTQPTNPTLTLTGTASSTGACSLTGSLVNQRCNLWGYFVDNLGCGVSRSAQGTVTFNINAGALSYSALAGTSSQASGTIASDGSGSVGFSFSSCTLAGYVLQNVSLVVSQSSSGIKTLQMTAGSMVLPGFATETVALTGAFSNDGTFKLTGTTSDTLSLSGLAVTSLARGATVTLTQNGLTLSGTVSGGVLSQIISGSGSANATLSIAANGSISLSGCATLSPLTLGQFQIRSTAGDGSFSACFNGNGLTVGLNTVQITYNGAPLTTPTLPSFTIALDGSFSIAVTAAMTAGLTLDSYNLSNASFTFTVSAGVATAQNFSASLSIPGFNPGFSSASAATLNGSLSSNGSFSLTGTTSSAQALTGLAVTSLANGSTVSLTQNGLTVTGTVSGGVLSQVISGSGSVNATLTVASNGSVSLSGCVTLSPLSFGQFQIRSTAADGSFLACFGAGLTVGQNTVRITYNGSPLTTPTLPSFTIAVNGSFSIAVTAAMTAGLTLDSYNLSNASFTFNVSAAVATAQNFSASLNIPGFNPGFSSASTTTLNGSLRSNGTFSLTGTSSSTQTLSGLAVTTLANGSSVSLTQNGLTITGLVSGGVLSQVLSGSASASANLAVAANGSVSLSGCVTLSPLTYGQFQIRSSAADGGFSACFGVSAGLTVAQNAVRIMYNGTGLAPLTTPTLPSFTIALDGSFSIAVSAAMTAGLTLDSIHLSNASFTFNVSGGVATAQNFSASLNIPGFTPGFSSAWTTTLNGSLSGNGTFSLTGTTSSAQTLSGLGVTTLANGSSVSLDNRGLFITGLVSGGVLSQVLSGSASAKATLALTDSGSCVIFGCVTLSPLTYGQFQIRSTAADGSFSACFTSPGLTVAQNTVRIMYNGAPLTTPTLPTIFIDANGSFSTAVTAAMTAGLSLDSYNLSNASFTFNVSAGVATANNFTASLNIPGFNPGFSSASATTLSGSLSSNGTFSLTGTSSSAQTLNGLAVTSLASGSNVSLTQNGLTISGTVSGGVLGHVVLGSGSANATLTVAANGSVSLSGCVTLSPLTFGQFQIRSTAADGSFSACFGAGLTVAQNTVRITYNGAPLTTPTLPSFSIAADGSLSISVSSSMTAGLTLGGFSLGNAGFLFSVSGGIATATKLGATLTIPSSALGFPKGAVTAKVTGGLNGDGTFALSGTLSGSQALSSSLPFADVDAGATLSLTQSGLAMSGSFVGGVLSQVPVLSTGITITIAADGSMTPGGTVTTSVLTDNQISIGPISGSGLTWNVTSLGLLMPAFTAQVGVNGVLSASIGLSGFTMSANGNFSASVSSVKGNVISVNVAGYAFTNVKLAVTRNGGVLSLSTFAGNLNLPGFGQYLSGTIDHLGTVALNFNGAISLGGFTASSDGALALSNAGLTASGTLNVSVNGDTLGSLYVVTTVSPTGGYSATASTSFNIGGYSTTTFTATVSTSGLTGSSFLNFGNLSVYLPNLSVSPSSVSANGSINRDSGWIKFFDVPGTEIGDIYGRLEGSVSLSVSGTGSVNASFSGTFGWWVVTLNHCDLFTGVCYYNYGPDPIPADHAISEGGSISSSGQFCVNQAECNLLGNCQNQFCFTLW